MSTEITNSQKWSISILSGLIFLIIASPPVYMLTNVIFEPLGLPTIINGVVTPFGLILHTIVFILIVRLLMK